VMIDFAESKSEKQRGLLAVNVSASFLRGSTERDALLAFASLDEDGHVEQWR
jgi:hypothetical protein